MHHKISSAIVQKPACILRIVQKPACVLDSGEDVTTEIKCFASNTCHSCALATYELDTEDDLDSSTEDDEAFH